MQGARLGGNRHRLVAMHEDGELMTEGREYCR